MVSTDLPAETGRDRCRVPECLCSVIPEAKPPKHSKITPPNEVTPDRLVVYFPEDQSELDPTDKAQIAAFLKKNAGSPYFNVTGYADICGDAQYNETLGEKRAQSAASYMSSLQPASNLRLRTEGEQDADAHHEYFRKVVITTSRGSSAGTKSSGWMSARLKECRDAGADVFLLDGSGSMQPYWADVQSFVFPPGSKVRLSIMTGCSNGSSLAAIRPTGGTEIWYSYWKVIEEMKPGQTLCIASDFQSNLPLKPWEIQVIEQKVAERGIKVHAIKY